MLQTCCLLLPCVTLQRQQPPPHHHCWLLGHWKVHFTSSFLDVPFSSFEKSDELMSYGNIKKHYLGMWRDMIGFNSSHYFQELLSWGALQDCTNGLWKLKIVSFQSNSALPNKAIAYNQGLSVCYHLHSMELGPQLWRKCNYLQPQLLGRMEIPCRVTVKWRNGFPQCNDRDVQQFSAI